MNRRELLGAAAATLLVPPAYAAPVARRIITPTPFSRYIGGTGVDPRQLPKWRKAKAGVLSQTANALVCVVGDSTTMGENSASVFSPKNVTYWLQQKLTASNPALFCNQSSFAGNPGSRSTLDPRFSGATNISNGPGTLGGPLFTFATGGTITFTPGVSFDTAVVQFYAGAISATVTGGTAATGSTGSALSTVTATTATPSASNSVTITMPSGSVMYLVSVQCYLSTQKSINIMNCGYYGAPAASICNATAFYGAVAAITQLAPALTILNIGINDWGAGNTVATWLSLVPGFVAAAQLSGDVILAIGNPTSLNPSLQPLYQAALYALALQLNVPFVDLQSRWVSYANASALGLLVDTLHPSATYGMPDIAEAYAEVALAV